jgi:hypothetical protein
MTIKVYKDKIEFNDYTLTLTDDGFSFDGDIETLGIITPPVSYAVIMGGYRNGFTGSDSISRVSITSLGTEESFGTLTKIAYRSTGTFGNTTRAFLSGGRNDSEGLLNDIQYVTFASGGSATDFGDRTLVGQNVYAINSDTRAVMAYDNYGGNNNKTLDYITMDTAGNAIDFGDLVTGGTGIGSACSPTRGLWSYWDSSYSSTTIDYVTTATAGNATNFGELAAIDSQNSSGFSSNTRGIVKAGGVNPNSSNSAVNTIEYVTIATTGNATDFGDLSYAGGWYPASTSNKVIGVVMGGRDLNTNVSYSDMDYITIATVGNGTDFGDLTQDMTTAGAAGNANGGLS